MAPRIIADAELQYIPQIASEQQIIYLDFDGGSATYRNKDLEITVEVDVEDSGMSEEQKRYILAELSEKYASENIFFTIEKPDEDQEYSTVYIGQTDDFDEYGSFAGLAENIDKGNHIKNDNAFVFADHTDTPDTVISVIKHELGHIIEGEQHLFYTGNIFDYAASYKESSSNSTTQLGTISENSTISGTSSSSSSDLDKYKFTAGFSGLVTFQLTRSNTSTYSAWVLDGNDNMLAGFGNSPASCYLEKGKTYLISINKNAINTSVLSYKITLTWNAGSTLPDPTPTPSPSEPDVTNPTGLSVTVSDNDVTFDWNDVYDSCGIAGYEIRYGTNSNLALYGTTLTTSASWMPLFSQENGTYYWQVRCKNNKGEYSDWVSGQSFTVNYDNAPDFIVDKLWVYSTEYKPDDVIKVKYTIGNTGEYFDNTTKLKIQVGNAVRYIDIPSIAINKLYWHYGEIDINAADIGGAGTYTIVASIDCYQAVSERSESNNSKTCSITITPVEYSNLVFYTPAGWDDQLVVSTQTGTSANATNFTTNDTIYLDFAVKNLGTEYNDSTVYVDIYVDNVKVDYWLYSLGLESDETYSWVDKSIGTLSAGTHTIKLQIRQNDKEMATGNSIITKTITVDAVPDTIPPTVPDNIVFSENNGVLTCSWDKSTDNTGILGYEFSYLLQRGSGKPTFTNATVINSDTNKIEIRNLPQGTYYYKIRAYDASGNYSAWTYTYATFSVTGYSDTAPATPTGIKYVIYNDQLTITWDPVKGTENGGGYQIRFETGKTGSSSRPTKKVDTTSCTVTNPANYLYCQVRSFNADGQYSPWSTNYPYDIYERTSLKKNIILYFPEANRLAEYSYDDFAHVLTIESSSDEMDVYALPQGICKVRSYSDEPFDNRTGTVIASLDNSWAATPEKYQSDADGDTDLFFAGANEIWKIGYSAEHHGSSTGWSGTGEKVALKGKNKIVDVFCGSDDANMLILTDDSRGDAIFLEDIYTSFGKDAARLSLINEIRAGAGDDIIDMTSQLFVYEDSGVKIRGGLGNDTIWANNGTNSLFGDAGNDRIVGGNATDWIVGGAGNDSMHGGGGDDIFTFGGDWGKDTIEQLDGGTVILWFETGSYANWDSRQMTYTDNGNSVKVSGISSDNVTLIFAEALGSDFFDTYYAAGAFAEASSERIFEDKNKGMLA